MYYYVQCACESRVKLFVVFVLVLVLYDLQIVRAVFSVNYELLWYHGSKSSVRVRQ
jgi:hypothetical protein